MKKKLLAVLLAASMVIGCTACGQSGGSEGTGSNTSSETTESTDQTSAGDEKVITMWSVATEGSATANGVSKAIATYESNHPGVKIKHETFENEAYKTKIRTAIAANEVPDIFFAWFGAWSEPFVTADKVLNLDDYYGAYSDEITQETLSYATFNGGLYGVPSSTPISVLYYNKALFDQYNVKVPTTAEEFMQACQTFTDNGVPALSTSVKENWVLAMLFDALQLHAVGPEMTAKTITRNGGDYSDPGFLQAAQMLRDLIDMGAFIEGVTGFSGDEANQAFIDGKTAMYVQGSWLAGSIQNGAENPDDFDLVPVPVLNSDRASEHDYMGGAAEGFMVAADVEDPDLVANAVFEISRSISENCYLDGSALPAWKVNYDDSEVPPMIQKLAGYSAEATSYTVWFNVLMTADDTEEYFDLTDQLFVGNITPEQYVQSFADYLK